MPDAWDRYDDLVDAMDLPQLRKALKREARLRGQYQDLVALLVSHQWDFPTDLGGHWPKEWAAAFTAAKEALGR